MKNNHTREETKKSSIKQNIKNCVLDKPLLTIIAISLVILAFLCMLFDFFIIIDNCKCIELGLTSENLSEEIRNSFLSLSLSYFNLVVAISIGIITLRLTLKIDQRNRMEELQNLKIRKILFYNQYENFTPSKLRYGAIYKNQFFIRINLSNFNSNYLIDIEKVYWCKCTQDFKHQFDEDDEKNEIYKLNKYKTHVENSKLLSFHIFFEDFENKDLKDGINYFYHINEYSPELMQKHERYRWMRLECCLIEKIKRGNEDPTKINILFDILLENRAPGKNHVKLLEIQHNITIKNN